MSTQLAKMITRPHMYFTLEASEMGLPPGMWPEILELEMTLGPYKSLIAMAFLMRDKFDYSPDGEVTGCRYTSESGNVNALVIND